MGKFEGNFEGFRVTPGSALATNSIVKEGALIGITRQNLAAGETGIAFMTNAQSVYTLELATTAVATAGVGTLVKDNGSGKIAIAGAGDTAIGCLFAPTLGSSGHTKERPSQSLQSGRVVVTTWGRAGRTDCKIPGWVIRVSREATGP